MQLNMRELSTQDPRWITGGISTNWQTVAKPLPAYLAAFSFNIKPFLAAEEAIVGQLNNVVNTQIDDMNTLKPLIDVLSL